MKNLWAWVDIETTGLDVEQDLILEVAVVLTDPELNVVDKISHVVKQRGFKPGELSDTVKMMHTKSGLISDYIHASMTLSNVEDDMRQFFQTHFGKSAVMSVFDSPKLEYAPPMCGASVHFDRSFLKEDMRNFERLFHYRNIDVSTYRRTFRDWFPNVPEYIQKKEHRALPDIMDSIQELKYYKAYIKV